MNICIYIHTHTFIRACVVNVFLCMCVCTISADVIKAVSGRRGGGDRETTCGCVCACDVIVYGCTWCDMRVDDNVAVLSPASVGVSGSGCR